MKALLIPALAILLSALLDNAPAAESRVAAGLIGYTELQTNLPGGRHETDDSSSVGGPVEMVTPNVVAGIKQRHGFVAERIGHRRAVGLERIALSAGQPEIVALGLAPGGFGNDVLHFQGDAQESLRAETVPTALPSVAPHLSSQTGGNVRQHQPASRSSSGSGQPRHLSRTRAYALRSASRSGTSPGWYREGTSSAFSLDWATSTNSCSDNVSRSDNSLKGELP